MIGAAHNDPWTHWAAICAIFAAVPIAAAILWRLFKKADAINSLLTRTPSSLSGYSVADGVDRAESHAAKADRSTNILRGEVKEHRRTIEARFQAGEDRFDRIERGQDETHAMLMANSAQIAELVATVSELSVKVEHVHDCIHDHTGETDDNGRS